MYYGGMCNIDSHDHGRRMEAQGQLTVTALPNKLFLVLHKLRRIILNYT